MVHPAGEPHHVLLSKTIGTLHHHSAVIRGGGSVKIFPAFCKTLSTPYSFCLTSLRPSLTVGLFCWHQDSSSSEADQQQPLQIIMFPLLHSESRLSYPHRHFCSWQRFFFPLLFFKISPGFPGWVRTDSADGGKALQCFIEIVDGTSFLSSEFLWCTWEAACTFSQPCLHLCFYKTASLIPKY